MVIFSVHLNLFAGNVQSCQGIGSLKSSVYNERYPCRILQAQKPAWVGSLQTSINNDKQVMTKKRQGWKRWIEPAAVTLCAGTAVYFLYSARGK